MPHYCTVGITDGTPIDRAIAKAVEGLLDKLVWEGEPLLNGRRSIVIYRVDAEVTAEVDDE